MEKKVRLNIGALTASSNDGGSFMFLLYKKEEMNKSLAVTLSPADTHSVLCNFSNTNKDNTTQDVFFDTLSGFRIELLDVEIVRDNDDSGFVSVLSFYDGEKKIQKKASFIDGVILAKKFSCPIYILEETFDKYATKATQIENFIKGTNEVERSLQILKDQLNEAVENEDYERAAKINKIINKLNKKN